MSEESRTAGAGGRLKVARGARAVEALLLGEIGARLAEAEAEPRLLARPVVLVVPSRALRLHLGAAVAAARGRAAVGLEIVTLHGLAAGVVERCDERRAAGRLLFDVLVTRFAGREPALAGLVSGFEDGELAIAATVRDLLDAGFSAASAEAAAEALAGHADAVERGRAEALLRVASGIGLALEAGGLELAGETLRRAGGLIAADPERALPARAVLVHGFADATGAATELIESLLRHRGACVYVDEPPDPADLARPDLGVAFSRRFTECLGGRTATERSGPAPSPPRRLELVAAPGAEAEVRETARRVRSLLDAGAAPELVGVVARQLAPYAHAVHRHFGRLGIPFAMLDAPGSGDAGTRRARALAELLRQQAASPAERWLAAAGEEAFDLRLALHACGAARVRDVATLDVAAVLDARGDLPLPVRTGLAVVTEAGAGEEVTVEPHRRLAGARLRRAAKRAAVLAARFDGWPAAATLAAHLRRLQRLLAADLGFHSGGVGAAAVTGAVAAVAGGLPESWRLAREEFFLLVRRSLAAVAGSPLGGEGGGVQVMSVTAARARTFAHLFILGLNRDTFPRQVQEDPLLPDRVRMSLAAVLPDIPIKRGGVDEERFLFAELVSAADEVTISWQACDDEGRVRPASPLVERLRLVAGIGEPPLAPAALAVAPPRDLRPAHEHAVLAGVHAPRADFAATFALACREAGLPAAGRLAVLDELDPERATPAGRARARGLGPYFGFVGPRVSAADPRRRGLAVTTAEQLAACPWQGFLQRLLRLEPSPDALAALPGVDRATVGTAVHRVLEEIVRAALPAAPATLAEALAATPTPLPWPEPAALHALVRDVCRRVARERGLALPGLDRVLARQVTPLLEAARGLAWPAAGAGAEVAGSVEVVGPQGAHPLTFRVDRVDRDGDAPVLTDFKTGAPLSTAKRETTRRRHLLRAIGRGEALQVAAYARAAGPGAVARYLFLRPELDPDAASVAARGDDSELAAAFATAAGAVVAAWESGAFFPRLEEPDGGDEPRRCATCEVRDGCLRGDSGSRRRLAQWAATAGAGDAADAAETALLALWRLHTAAGTHGETEEG